METKIKPSEKLILRRKWELLRAIQRWQDAEPESEDEQECEEIMRKAELALLKLVPDYNKDFRLFTYNEMEFKLKQELGVKMGERV